MSADLTKPFNESCCDGGETSSSEMSCQPCGCDKGANWVCNFHKVMAKMKEAIEREALENGKS